jgi:monothiol glutaredoxin
MNRPMLKEENVASEALKSMSSFHPETIKEVSDAVSSNKVVIVGMTQNPVVKKACKALDQSGISYKYLGYGSYFSMWKPRLAIKLWSGWPTYPQIFVDGKLVGGCKEMLALLNTGLIKK